MNMAAEEYAHLNGYQRTSAHLLGLTFRHFECLKNKSIYVLRLELPNHIVLFPTVTQTSLVFDTTQVENNSLRQQRSDRECKIGIKVLELHSCEITTSTHPSAAQIEAPKSCLRKFHNFRSTASSTQSSNKTVLFQTKEDDDSDQQWPCYEGSDEH